MVMVQFIPNYLIHYNLFNESVKSSDTISMALLTSISLYLHIFLISLILTLYNFWLIFYLYVTSLLSLKGSKLNIYICWPTLFLHSKYQVSLQWNTVNLTPNPQTGKPPLVSWLLNGHASQTRAHAQSTKVFKSVFYVVKRGHDKKITYNIHLTLLEARLLLRSLKLGMEVQNTDNYRHCTSQIKKLESCICILEDCWFMHSSQPLIP